MTFNRIKEVRKSKGITQAELARRLGVTQGAIQFWENGEREPSIKTLKDVAKILDCEPWELLPLDMQPKINPKDLELIKLLKAITKSNEAIDTDTATNKAG